MYLADTHGLAISLAEMVIKSMNGRWEFPDGMPGKLVDHGLGVLDVSGGHAAVLRKFPELTRHDPFDRIMIAQAKCERLTFLTADRRLLALRHDWIVHATQ